MYEISVLYLLSSVRCFFVFNFLGPSDRFHFGWWFRSGVGHKMSEDFRLFQQIIESIGSIFLDLILEHGGVISL